jgi:hypothetical protein
MQRDKKAYPRGDPKLKHWATSPVFWQVERPKAKALGYLEAKTEIHHYRRASGESAIPLPMAWAPTDWERRDVW